MNTRQRFLKIVYPIFTWYKRITGKGGLQMTNKKNQKPLQSFFNLSVTLNNGKTLYFNSLKDKKVLLVNTASDCGYTAQYDELQKLYEDNKDKLMIIGFPANDFNEQEKGTDAAIAEFCRINYGISFPLAVKGVVKKDSQQQPVFQWLTDKNKNGWSNKGPSWNFSKWLVDEEGILTDYFEPAVSPLDILKKIS